MAAMLRVNSSDPAGVVRKSLLPELEAIKRQLTQFQSDYEPILPTAAAASLKRFLGQGWSASGQHPAVDIQAIVPLAVFRAEFEYLLQDAELYARSITELAFEHLRRLLAVDEDVQQKWRDAFGRREEHCERLGATHLLSHGIWAFKVSGTGAATDLVFPEPIANELGLVRRTARALVLTEWKLVKAPGEAERKAEEARKQTQSYVAGILGELELKSTRYVILVALKDVPTPSDQIIGSVTFRHVVLAIAPNTPSKESRSRPHNSTLQQTGARAVRPGR